MVDVTFKNVDERVLREFKAEAVRESKKFGNALVEAIQFWLANKKTLSLKKKMKLSDIKPTSFGPGSENGSIEVDKIVYGI